MARPKKQYDVFVGGMLKRRTWAVSEKQAVNNVVYRLYGTVPEDRRPQVVAKEVATSVMVLSQKKQRQHLPQQLVFPGM